MRNLTYPALALAALLLLSAPVGAVTFSFASDDNDDGPTFQGHSGGSMVNDFNEGSAPSADGTVQVDLMVDLNDDASGGVVIFPSVLTFGGNISGYSVVARGAGFVHQWDVSGSFTFRHQGTGQLLLVVSFDNGLFTTYSPSVGSLGETATLQDSAGVDSALTFTPSTMLAAIGVTSTSVSASEDFAFTLTNIRSTVLSGLPYIDHGQFLHGWIAEGSFSAHASKSSSTGDPTLND